MTYMDVLTVLSLLVGLVSIGLAVFAMQFAKKSEEQSRDNFERTQDMMRSFYDKTKDLLNEVDKRTSVTEKAISSSQQQLLSTMTSIVNETVIPKKQDVGEQIGLMFFQQLLSNPKEAGGMMEALKPFMDMVEQDKKKTGR